MEKDLLTIKLSKLGDIPQVYYKGEEITKKQIISFGWESQTDEYGGCRIYIKHIDNEAEISRRTIVHEEGKFIFDDIEAEVGDHNSKSN